MRWGCSLQEQRVDKIREKPNTSLPSPFPEITHIYLKLNELRAEKKLTKRLFCGGMVLVASFRSAEGSFASSSTLDDVGLIT
jgi:hypothetical protein